MKNSQLISIPFGIMIYISCIQVSHAQVAKQINSFYNPGLEQKTSIAIQKNPGNHKNSSHIPNSFNTPPRVLKSIKTKPSHNSVATENTEKPLKNAFTK